MKKNHAIAKCERKILDIYYLMTFLFYYCLKKASPSIFIGFVPSPATTISWSMFFSHVWSRQAGCKTSGVGGHRPSICPVPPKHVVVQCVEAYWLFLATSRAQQLLMQLLNAGGESSGSMTCTRHAMAITK